MDERAADKNVGEPDYRFTLANERTFLAWVRTAVAMMAAAVAVVKLVPGNDYAWLRRTLGVLLALLAAFVGAGAYERWRTVQRAMREGKPLPRSLSLPVVGIVLGVISVLVLVLVIVG